MAPSVVLVIPAYRPGAALPRLVSEARGEGGALFAGIVVVDDGSGAEFRPLFDGLHEATVLRHAVNLGKGAALKTAFNHALLAWPEAAGIVTADADGQHTIGDILRVARHLAAHPAEVVLGVRGFDGAVPLRSRVGNFITRGVFQLFTGLNLADTQTGLRGWPARYAPGALRLPINGYDFELECLLEARDGAEFRVTQLPIETIYEDGNRSSHFNPVRDSFRIYFVFARYCGASLTAALIDSAFFYLAYHSTGWLAWSQVVGRLASLVIAFTLQRNLVFRSDASVMRSLVKYLSLVIVMGVVAFHLMRFLHLQVGVPVLAAKLMAEGTLFLVNFSLVRTFIFTRAKTPTGAE
jgi:glycosyltransferase involved in cell wall biosynthesis